LFDLKTEPTTYEEIIARARHVRSKLGLIQAPQPVTIRSCPPPKKPIKVRQSPRGSISPKTAAPLSEAATAALRAPDMQSFISRHYNRTEKNKGIVRFIDNIERWVEIQRKPRPDWVILTIRQFCAERRVPSVVMFSDCKIDGLVDLRHELWAKIHANYRKPSYTQIALWFCRDHTSILYGVTRNNHGDRSALVRRKRGPKAVTAETKHRKAEKQRLRRDALRAAVQAWDASKWGENV
jgi:hypothetical protein